MQLLFHSNWGAVLSLVAALAYLNMFAGSGASSRTLFQGRNYIVLKSHEVFSLLVFDLAACWVESWSDFAVSCGKAQEMYMDGSSL